MRPTIKYFVLAAFWLLPAAGFAQEDSASGVADTAILPPPPELPLDNGMLDSALALPTAPAEYVPEEDLWGIGLRIINGHSAQLLEKGRLEFCIQHRFGLLSSGYDGAWGFDQSNIRLGFDYGLHKNITLGVGRAGMGKTVNGFAKFGLADQRHGRPLSIAWLSDMAYVFEKNTTGLAPWYTSHRINYTHQLLLSRTLLYNRLMIQLAPTVVHRNLVDSIRDANDVPLMVGNFRLKLNRRLSLTGEYCYIVNQRLRGQVNASAGMGLEIWTGGHVFQITFTNANTLNESRFMTQQNGDIRKGDFRLGFNIVRAW